MVLVRDKKGHLFGGYAAEGWSKHGQFYGSALSFIFSIAPAVARFRASGANDNMLWCGQGFSQLPNGIGWGGKVSIWSCCRYMACKICPALGNVWILDPRQHGLGSLVQAEVPTIAHWRRVWRQGQLRSHSMIMPLLPESTGCMLSHLSTQAA